MTDKILGADSTPIANIISCEFKESVNTEECLRFGAAVASSIEFKAYGTQANAPAVGEVLTYYQTDGNGVDTLIGKFIATPSVPSKNAYTVVAYDSIILLEADFSEQLAAIQSSFPMTLNALLSEVATVAGVTFGNNPTLGSTSIAEFSASGVSCRQVVAWAAEMSGQYVYADTSGDICFGWYSAVSGKKVYKQSGSSGGVTYVPYKQDGLDYKDFAVSAVDGVAVFPPEVEGAAAIYPAAASGNMYNVRDNLLLSGASVATLDSVAQNLYTVLSALTAYRPCSINLFRFDNPFRAGDIIAVEDAQGVSFNTLVMSMTVGMDGATVECTGRETYDGDYGTSYRDELVNLAANVVRIDKLKVDWADINTAIINYLTANDVTAQNVTIVDASNNVIATFNDTGITLYNNGAAVATYNSSTVVLGEANKNHAEIDYNSFELYDSDGTLYCSIGTTKDTSGFENITLNYVGDGSTTMYAFNPLCSQLTSVQVKVNGSVVNNYTKTTYLITFLTAPLSGDDIVITYKTTYGLYHYDLGQRAAGSNIGVSSFVAGERNEASGYCSSVIGGYQNIASGDEAVASGGHGNSSTGGGSFSGGNGNVSSGGNSFAFGGGNTASGVNSTAFGMGNVSNHREQIVFGAYNTPDPSSAPNYARGNYIEIVGNGLSENAQSNARTLDWSGNEVLAGGLTINGNQPVLYGAQTTYNSGSADMNDFTTPGLYYFSGGVTKTNQPGSNGAGWLLVLQTNSTVYRQIWFRNSGTAYGDTYTRIYSGSWTNWIEYYTEQNADDAVNAGLSTASYSTTGLTPTNCTIGAGGYYRVGNLVVVNMRVSTTASISGGTTFISGLPAPDTTLAASNVALGVTCSDPNYGLYMIANGNIRNNSNGSAIPSGLNLGISVTYIAKP